MSSDLIDHLERFDRKERPLLFRLVTSSDDRLVLNHPFRDLLQSAIDDEPIPREAFVAFDYHLNWLHAAIQLTHGDWEIGKPAPKATVPSEGSRKAIERNQEDIDLLVAWDSPKGWTGIALVEAKAYSGWTNKQVQSKAARLALVFDGVPKNKVRPYFLLTSFKQSAGLSPVNWPTPGTVPPHIELVEPDSRLVLTQTRKNGKPSSKGNHYLISERPKKQT